MQDSNVDLALNNLIHGAKRLIETAQTLARFSGPKFCNDNDWNELVGEFIDELKKPFDAAYTALEICEAQAIPIIEKANARVTQFQNERAERVIRKKKGE